MTDVNEKLKNDNGRLVETIKKLLKNLK